MTYMTTSQHKNHRGHEFCNFCNPFHGHHGHEIYNFGRSFHGYHYCQVSLSDLCLGIEKTILNAFSLYDLYSLAPAPESRPWWSLIYNFGNPFLGHHYYTLSLTEPCLGIEKKIFFRKYIDFTLLTPKLPPLKLRGRRRGHEMYNFLSP